jgi:hypothetical protein
VQHEAKSLYIQPNIQDGDIAENPDLLIALDTASSNGALDGWPWERPEIIYKVLSLSPRLPYLRQVLSSFFKGALHTWEQFTSEFEGNGTIALATPEQRHSAWLPPTNDVSEGLLGQSRQMVRRAPTMTDMQRNSRVMWQRNSTYEWAKQTLTHADAQFVWREARRLDASGASRNVRLEISQALEERAAANQARQAKVA